MGEDVVSVPVESWRDRFTYRVRVEGTLLRSSVSVAELGSFVGGRHDVLRVGEMRVGGRQGATEPDARP